MTKQTTMKRLAAARKNTNHPLGVLTRVVSKGTPIAGVTRLEQLEAERATLIQAQRRDPHHDLLPVMEWDKQCGEELQRLRGVDESRLPPYPRETVWMLRERGHTVTVRQQKTGSYRYTIDGSRERTALQMDRFYQRRWEA